MFQRSIRNARTARPWWLPGALALTMLTACTTTRPAPAILLPPSSLEPCLSGDPDQVVTVQDLAAFSIGQEAALKACEAKRAALVEAVKGVGN